MWYVYIAQCADGSLYTGIATDPQARLKRHRDGRGSKYVRMRGISTLLYVEKRLDRSDAQRREYEIKSWSRQKKLALVAASSHAPRGL